MIPPSTPEFPQPRSSGIRRLAGNDSPPQEELLVPQMWRMLRTRRSLIVGWVLACLLLSVLYILGRSSRYQATARIEVSPVGTNSMGLDEMTSRMLSPSDPTIQLQSAVTVLQSNTIALAVMQQMKMAERKTLRGDGCNLAALVADLPPEVRDNLLLRFHKNLEVEIVPKTDIIACNFGRRTRNSPPTS